MIKRLRLKFIAAIMITVTVLLSIIFGLVYHFTSQSLKKESFSMMQRIASDPFHRDALNEPSGQVQLPYFTVQLGSHGELLATSGGYFDLSDEKMLDKIIEMAYSDGETSGVLKDYSLRYCRFNSAGGRCIVFADISSELATLSALTRNCAAVGAAALLLFLAISFFLARWAVRPVEQAWQQQKQFVADASHELKTPLAVIMTNAELLKGTPCSESQEKYSSNILVMSQQMRGLVNGLLELARADNGNMKTAFHDFDLSSLLQQELLLFEPVFFENGLSMESSVAPGIFINGSPEHIKQTAGILLDNAVKYAESGSEVNITLQPHGRSHCMFSVETRGRELSADELKMIFTRFYRADQSRSGSGSYGLGLPIARQIVSMHSGRIWAESRNGSNIFYVLLPCQDRHKKTELQ